MKKLLVVLSILLVGIFVGACAPSSAPIEQEETLYCITGLNGQQVCYEQEEYEQVLSLFQSVNAKDTFDKSKAPSYMLDDLEEYVSFSTVAKLLKDKYYGETTYERDLYDIGGRAIIQYVIYGEMDYNDFIARTILLIEELRLYEFYIISCPELSLYLVYNDQIIIIDIPLVVMINDMFTIAPDGVYDGDYEMELKYQDEYVSLDLLLIEQYYNDYITNETFIGTVLNY